MSDLLILLAVVLFFASAGIALYRTRLCLDPFSLCCLAFALSGLFWRLHIFYPSNSYDDSIHEWVAFYILLFAVFTFFVNAAILKPFNTQRFRRNFQGFAPPSWFIVTICVPSLIYAILLLKQCGWVPPILIENRISASGHGAHRTDYEVPFIGECGLGCYRALLIIFTIDFLNKRMPLLRYVCNNRTISAAMLILPLIYVLIGRRNPISWGFFIILYAVALSGRLKLRSIVVAGLIFVVIFLIVGQFRRGGRDYVDDLTYKTGIESVDTGLSWFAAYFAPDFVNLNSFFDAKYPLEYGNFWLSRLIPDEIYSLFGTKPDDSADRMSNDGQFQYDAMIYNTMFPDFSLDFGPVGAWLIGCFLYFSMALLSSNNYGSLAFICFLNFAPSLLQMFASNKFMGLANLVGFFIAAFAIFFIARPTRQVDIRQATSKFKQRIITV